MNARTEAKDATAVHKTIASALAAAQAQMGKALKSANNPHFKSKYADLASVCDACLPALNANGIAVVQPFHDDETGRYVKTMLIHGDSGETLECRVPLIVAKNDMQGFGSAATYARRYGLMSMAGIAPEDDDGNAAAKAAPLVDERPQNHVSEGLRDAWKDAVMDSLPENATPRQKAEGFAAAIVRDFGAKTGVKALDNEWERRKKLIDALEEGHPDLHEKIVDAFEVRMNDLRDK